MNAARRYHLVPANMTGARPIADPAANADSKDYPVAMLLSVVGDAWTPIVLHQLAWGPVRYGVLRRSLPGISKKMLTQTLRRLQNHELVLRRVIDENPPGASYALTTEGRRLLEPLGDMCAWAQKNADFLRAINLFSGAK